MGGSLGPFLAQLFPKTIQQQHIDFELLSKLMPQLSEIISQLSQNCLYLKALKQAKSTYSINYADLKALSPYNVFQLLKKFNHRIETTMGSNPQGPQSQENLEEECWHPSEYKLFCWMSVCYAFTINKDISEFKSHNTEFVLNIFKNKKPIFIEYNLLCLQRQPKSKKEEWSNEEKDMFLTLMNDDKLKGKWSDISYNLYCKSDKNYFRTAHSCRQMWFNHLNPIVKHSKWTLSEDIQLFKLAGELGTKWARISKSLNGVRTQHMVKNRFNAITKKYQSRYQRCSTRKIIELIRKHLEQKMEIEKDNQDLSNSKDESQQANSRSASSSKKINEIIEEEQEKSSTNELQQCKRQQAHENQTQMIHIVPEAIQEPTAEVEQYKQREPRQIGFQVYEASYNDMKEEQIVCEGSLADWVENNGHRNVELVDYTDYYPEYKVTIFSGTNS